MAAFSNLSPLSVNGADINGAVWCCSTCWEEHPCGVLLCWSCEEYDTETFVQEERIGDLPLKGQVSRETEGICPSRAERRDHQSGCSRHKRCSGHRPHHWYAEVVNRRGEICSRADAALEEELMKLTALVDGFGLAEKGQTAPVVCWDRQIKAKRVKQARYQARKVSREVEGQGMTLQVELLLLSMNERPSFEQEVEEYRAHVAYCSQPSYKDEWLSYKV